jgi:hypothetical protein
MEPDKGQNAVSRTDDSVEYDAFEQLTKELLKVSKKDLDEARAKEQADKR